MKKTLLALATASTVAFAGTSVAVAENEDPTPGSASAALSGKKDEAPNTEAPNTESSDTSSSDELFGWDETVKPLQKLEQIAKAFGIIVTVVGGIATLIASFQKIADSFKK
ncbi:MULTISPECIES: hypothetical protein [Corynebacterium]|uniref:hypothetical protein n=1 Tax=Corynebacterium TaxID=1716 RepID=UPI0008A1CDB7|nr:MULTISPECIES: hypothetical protein [Corynebacterium]OFT90974.1 hypothetical protein HMPREF3098_01855 [Corynebacterium sp. HMSC28B08]